MKKIVFVITTYLLFFANHAQAQVQWASNLIDFSSEYKDDLIRSNSTRWSATQVLGYPNSTKYGTSQLAWTPQRQDGSKEYVTVGFKTPQTVQQVIVGENYNAGSVTEIILYDNKGKKYSVYENPQPKSEQKFNDVLTYFKIKPTYNVVKLKLVINTNTTFGREEIDCIGISSDVLPYKQNINVVKYSEPVGKPENLGSNVNSSFYDHLPLISPDGSLLYFTRKLEDDGKSRGFNDDIYVSQVLPSGHFSKAENIGSPLNTADNNFACFISSDNNRLYVANKYIKNTYNFDGLSVSTKQKDGTWSKPKPLNIPDVYNKNEFAHYYMNLDETVVLMAIQRDDSYGDLDLYVAQKYGDGSWSSPKNLGPTINTVGAEGSVFLAADGKTLYFSSTGHPGFGSYDMFMSKRLDNSWTNWSPPLNLGDKINSDEMDIYYTIPASGDYAYFSSGITVFGNNDLYRIKLPKEARPEYVDVKKLVANAPLKTEPASVVNATLSPQRATTSTSTQPASTSTKSTVPTTLAQSTQPTTPTVSTPSQPISNKPSTDEFQRKLDELKRQQTQAAVPTTQSTQAATPIQSTTIKTETKREVVNSIQPYQTPEERQPKPTVVNTIQPAEMPKPAPKVLTQEELAARAQQKTNPTINPNQDNLNALSKQAMPTVPQTTPVNPSAARIQNPTIVTTEVDVNSIDKPATSTASNPMTLRTAAPQVDEYQQKLDELRKQQNQISSQPLVSYESSTPTKSITEQYPNPKPVIAESNAKVDELQQKLEALKQQRNEVGQSNKLNTYYYTPKPYDPQPLKERQDDLASKEYDDYQKKLDDLKKQQKSIVPVVPTPPITAIVAAPTVVNPKEESKKIKNATVVSSTPTNAVTTNPVITKYEEKLKKLQEEMERLKVGTSAPDTKLPSSPETPTVMEFAQTTAPSPTLAEKEKSTVETIVVPRIETQPKLDTITVSQETQQESRVIAPENNSTSDDLEKEKKKLEAIQEVQKLAEQRLQNTLEKMDSSKKSLESDIADLQEQRQKFSNEKEKLTAQNTQLAGEKEKLETEKKKMDDLLAQMQTERDKLAEEKRKMEEDKEKLDALKRQQEREVLALKRSIDSLGKVQQKTATAVQQSNVIFDVPLQVGAVAQVNNIYFVADAAYLQIPSYVELDKVALFLNQNKNLKVEIGGHTNGLCDEAFCQKLSENRAKTCVDYLIKKGIAPNRLTYKGYGKTKLLKPNDLGNSLNQRVEIKIISVD